MFQYCLILNTSSFIHVGHQRVTITYKVTDLPISAVKTMWQTARYKNAETNLHHFINICLSKATNFFSITKNKQDRPDVPKGQVYYLASRG